MFRAIFISFVFGVFSLLQGCSSGPSLVGQPYYRGPAEVSSDSATIYFFRNKNKTGSAVTQNIAIDGKFVGTLPNGGYFKVKTTAGTRNVVASRGNFLQGELGDGEFKLLLESGKAYFVANETSTRPYTDDRGLTDVKEGTFRSSEHYYFRWAALPQAEAEQRMQACQLVPTIHP